MINDLRILAALAIVCAPGIAFWAAVIFLIRSI